MRRQPPEEDRDLSHSWRGHGTYSSFEKKFQRMFQEFENIFRGTFSERPSIEYKFHDFSKTPEEEESKIFCSVFILNILNDLGYLYANLKVTHFPTVARVFVFP